MPDRNPMPIFPSNSFAEEVTAELNSLKGVFKKYGLAAPTIVMSRGAFEMLGGRVVDTQIFPNQLAGINIRVMT